ncbi:hypothetical protein [Microlunatus speluncae]|uniref:hypothetical protein n=1 Tax=Microlunatus speluncae TaxID=2594267 RepID=UPI0012666428|nr:hypothetical protein [Microlunatus speluncae]
MANLVRTLARNKLVQKITKNERIRGNRHYQALRFSIVRKPLNHHGSRVPIALRIKVGSKIDIGPGADDFFAGLRGVVWADPLRISRWDHIAVWRVNKDTDATALANELGRRVFPSKNRDLVCVIDERNPQLTSAHDLLTLLSRTRIQPTVDQFTEQRNLVVVLDPPTRTSLSVASTWGRTRTVAVLTRPSPFPPSCFAEVDALLIADGVDPEPYADLRIPFTTTFSEPDEALAQIKALVSGSLERPPGYHFAILGDIDELPAGVDSEIDIVCVIPEELDASVLSSFAEYLDALIDLSLVIAVHSRFLYSHETLIRAEQPAVLLQRLIERGARLRIQSPSPTPSWRPR